VIAEGAALNMPSGASSRRYLPYALLATVAVVVLPALAMLPLAPLEGALDVLVSAVLAIGLSVAMGSIGSALWSRRPESKDVVFGDLMLWRWIRRVIAERRMARTTVLLADGIAGIGTVDDPLLPALQRLALELEARDSFMSGHSQRVARHARRIACQMGLDENEVARIEAAASVHDVGKVFLPHSILAQPGPLTDEQYALVKRHAEQGAELVAELDDPELTAIVRHHHERVDGAGYPDGLAGGDIPLGARIVAVADTFDAITSDRPYRRAASRRSAIDIVSQEAGSQLDADVVAAFVEYYSGKRGIAGAAVVATAPPRLVGWLAATPAGLGVSAAPIAQGVCAAGAIALAGVCLGGSPGTSSAPDRGEAADARAAQVTAHGVAASPSSGVGRDRSRDGVGPDTRRRSAGKPRVGGDDRSTGGTGGGRAPVGGQAPGAPTGAPWSGPRTPVSSPGATLPDADLPDVPVTSEPVVPLPVSPPQVLDPVVDPVIETVDQVLAPAPAPVKGITDPAKKLLDGTGLTSSSP
jgi:hypothetical protein